MLYFDSLSYQRVGCSTVKNKHSENCVFLFYWKEMATGLINRHHCVPLSLGGWNFDRCKMPLDEEKHKLLHALRDLPHKQYSKMIRKHREATSWHIVMTEKWLMIMQEMQRYFFENKNLPQDIMEKENEVLVETVKYWNNVYNKITGETYVIEDFTNPLECKIWVELETQREILRALRKAYIL